MYKTQIECFVHMCTKLFDKGYLMARPAKFDRDEALETIMQAFWRDGYDSCSVKALSEMLGISRSSFYNAFGTREALFKEIIERYFAITPDIPLGKAAMDTPLKPLLTRVFKDICSVLSADKDARGCLAVNSATELCGRHDTLGPFMAEYLLANLTRLKTLLRWAVERGELPRDTDINGKALALKNLILGINVLSRIVTSKEQLWTTARTTLTALDLIHEETVQ